MSGVPRAGLAIVLFLAAGLTAAERPIARAEAAEPSGAGARFGTALATNGDGYLVVWSDTRPPGQHIRGMRLDATNGEVRACISSVAAPALDAAVDLGTGTAVSAAAGPAGFAVLILRETYVPHSAAKEDVRAVFLAPDLMPVRETQMAIASSAARTPDVVPAGSGWMVVLSELLANDPLAPGGEIDFLDATVFLRLDGQGRWLGPFEELRAGYASDPATVVARDGSIAVASSGRTVAVQRLAPDGRALLSGEGTIASMSRATQDRARVKRCPAFDAVVWEETIAEERRLRLRRYAPDGSDHGAAITLAAGAVSFGSLVCGRSTALLTWVDRTTPFTEEQRAVTFGAAGALLPAILGGRLAALAFDGTHYVGIRTVYTGSQWRDAFVRWDEQGTEVSSALAEDDDHVAIGWNGTEFLAIRRDALPPGRWVAERLDAQFRPIGEWVEIALSGADSFSPGRPFVVASPDAWLVVWNRSLPDGIRVPYTSRLRRDGTLLDPPGGVQTGFGSPQGVLDVSWSGSRWELVTENGMVTRGRDGAVAEFRFTSGTLQGVAGRGETRLAVYTRLDPVDGVQELFGDDVDPAAWGVTPPRRRMVRR